MPFKMVSAEEFQRLTGETGSVYFETPAKRPETQYAYLCPHCYELCTGSRPGVLRCDMWCTSSCPVWANSGLRHRKTERPPRGRLSKT